jgi:hypothetical protein
LYYQQSAEKTASSFQEFAIKNRLLAQGLLAERKFQAHKMQKVPLQNLMYTS